MTATLVAALFIAIVGRLMADEVKAWFGWLHREMRRRAVNRLPTECRERYDEEWESGLEEIPGDIFKFIHSVGLFRAAAGIRNATKKNAVGSEKPVSPLKRVFDIVFSSFVLLFLSPFLLAIAIAIKLNSPDPVFYASERIGKKGRVFHCLKFRTMVRDAEKRCADITHMNERDGVLFKITSDSRITELGQFMRKYSLDELPQFFNVLRGDMTVVGPRPPIAGGPGSRF